MTSMFKSGGAAYAISVNAGPADGKRHPLIVLVHGNYGLGAPYGEQIHGLARTLAASGYVTAVPQYYTDDQPHPTDTTPHDRTLADAVATVAERADCDATRLGLIGYSLGAATAMTFIANHPAGTVKAFADNFGFLTPAIRAGIAKFPPTIIFHNKNDRIVPVAHSSDLARLLPAATEHLLVGPYDEQWQEVNHAFKPGGPADVDSRSQMQRWFAKHLPPTGTAKIGSAV